MKKLHSLAIEQKENAKHGEAFFSYSKIYYPACP